MRTRSNPIDWALMPAQDLFHMMSINHWPKRMCRECMGRPDILEIINREKLNLVHPEAERVQQQADLLGLVCTWTPTRGTAMTRKLWSLTWRKI